MDMILETWSVKSLCRGHAIVPPLLCKMNNVLEKTWLKRVWQRKSRCDNLLATEKTKRSQARISRSRYATRSSKRSLGSSVLIPNCSSMRPMR